MVVPILPPTVVLPAPCTVKLVAVPVIAPNVSSALLVFTSNTEPVAESVTAPKVTPAVPEVVVASEPMVNVCAPMESVPSVCVTPAPELRRSELICVLAVTVVLRPKFSPVSLANSSSPPPSESAPVPKALVWVVARRVPALKVVVPE